MGGSNEFVECFCWGAVAEGGSGAVVELVGDGVEVGLVAGDGGSFGQVSADEPVGVFVGSSLPRMMWKWKIKLYQIQLLTNFCMFRKLFPSIWSYCF